jgi:Sensory domain found in PocR
MLKEQQPRTRQNKELIDMLRRSRLFRDYENVFTKATGLPLTLRPLEFWQLAHHGKKNENPFCALLAERPATLAVCLKAHDDMIKHTDGIPHSITCPFGLTETAIPVKLGSEIISYLRIGQVLRHVPIKSDTTKVSRELKRCGVRFSGEIRKAWEKNPLIPPDNTMPLCGCSGFLLSNSQVWRTNWSLNRKTSSHRSWKRRVITSTSTRWNRFL